MIMPRQLPSESRQDDSVGDLLMSLIHTCELNHANPFDYLNE
jgi:hypothetical protein